MNKIQNNFKSKKFISFLSTVLRAFSFVLHEGYKIKFNENDAVKLFGHFYKLLFLGSPFAEKMLHILFVDPSFGKEAL